MVWIIFFSSSLSNASHNNKVIIEGTLYGFFLAPFFFFCCSSGVFFSVLFHHPWCMCILCLALCERAKAFCLCHAANHNLCRSCGLLSSTIQYILCVNEFQMLNIHSFFMMILKFWAKIQNKKPTMQWQRQPQNLFGRWNSTSIVCHYWIIRIISGQSEP